MAANCKRRESNFELDHCPILNLPKEILITILCTLPTTTILNCKRVCKAWGDIILDPFFAEAHHNYTTTTTDELNLNLVINPNTYHQPYVPDSLYLVEGYDDDNDQHDYKLIISSKLMNNPSSLTNHRRFRIVNSCRGFLYLHTTLKLDYEFFVYNPLTEQHFMLPPVTVNIYAKQHIGMMGLGFGPLTKQYKAVRLTKIQGSFDLRVYTVGVDHKWRPVQIPTDLIDREFTAVGEPADVNGILHWSMLQKSNRQQIACFDVDKEKVSTMALPESFLEKHPNSSILVVSIFNVCGFLGAGIKERGSKKTEIWIMKEYGINDSWVKYFGLKDDIHIVGSSPYLIEVSKNRDNILLYENNRHTHFLSYNCKEKTSTRLKIRGFDNEKTMAAAIVYVPSFFTMAR